MSTRASGPAVYACLMQNFERVTLQKSIVRLLLCVALGHGAPAWAQERNRLIELINDYRTAAQSCDGHRSRSLPALASHPALSSVHVAPGRFLDQALEGAGYAVARAEAITISGPADAREVITEIGQRYCRTLLSREFSAIGVNRSGASWQIVFAQPAAPPRVVQLPGQRDTALAILKAVNAARATGVLCGERRHAPAPPLLLNSALGDAALIHSVDMAARRYLSHQGKDGRKVSDRALQAGYLWSSVGENIAAGQESAEDVVAGWIESPGHCANLMNTAFSDMGAAYAIHGAGRTARVYWTQVFGRPR